MRPLDKQVKEKLDTYLEQIEGVLQADGISIISPILYGLDLRVRDAIESIQPKKEALVVIHDTPGGIVEVVERMVDSIRHFYKEVIFIIPDRAMSAGTIFALSGDRILMDYFSCLGPIDPQIEKEGKLFPALSYLNEFERLNKKSEEGKLTSAEYALVSKLDLGELYQFKQARELSCELLIEWLTICCTPLSRPLFKYDGNFSFWLNFLSYKASRSDDRKPGIHSPRRFIPQRLMSAIHVVIIKEFP